MTVVGNIQISPEIVEAVRVGTTRDWEGFTNTLRQNLQGRVEGALLEDLPALKYKLQYVSELQNIFSEILQNPKK